MKNLALGGDVPEVEQLNTRRELCALTIATMGMNLLCTSQIVIYILLQCFSLKMDIFLKESICIMYLVIHMENAQHNGDYILILSTCIFAVATVIFNYRI